MTQSFNPFFAQRQEILRQMAIAAQDAGREPADIELVAVSKTQPDQALKAALDAGQRIFGENRVQEAHSHWRHDRFEVPQDMHVRLIGPLQSNKAKEAVGLFDVIETLDRPSLAVALRKEIDTQGKAPLLLVQVNIGKEPQKAGVDPDQLAPFLDDMRENYRFDINGLMAIPPATADPKTYFAQMAEMAQRHGLKTLSMGMSGDFPAAIACGATHVRVGTALFGQRPPLLS